jgi:hypothetical protein
MQRILATTLINLPDELVRVVKDYSFFTIVEGLQRKRKGKVVYSIQKAGEDPDFIRDLQMTEHWAFTGYNEENEENPWSEPQLQAENCAICGEYITCGSHSVYQVLISKNRLCKCDILV